MLTREEPSLELSTATTQTIRRSVASAGSPGHQERVSARLQRRWSAPSVRFPCRGPACLALRDGRTGGHRPCRSNAAWSWYTRAGRKGAGVREVVRYDPAASARQSGNDAGVEHRDEVVIRGPTSSDSGGWLTRIAGPSDFQGGESSEHGRIPAAGTDGRTEPAGCASQAGSIGRRENEATRQRPGGPWVSGRSSRCAGGGWRSPAIWPRMPRTPGPHQQCSTGGWLERTGVSSAVQRDDGLRREAGRSVARLHGSGSCFPCDGQTGG
jgi:hypothetical protein